MPAPPPQPPTDVGPPPPPPPPADGADDAEATTMSRLQNAGRLVVLMDVSHVCGGQQHQCNMCVIVVSTAGCRWVSGCCSTVACCLVFVLMMRIIHAVERTYGSVWWGRGGSSWWRERIYDCILFVLYRHFRWQRGILNKHCVSIRYVGQGKTIHCLHTHSHTHTRPRSYTAKNMSFVLGVGRSDVR